MKLLSILTYIGMPFIVKGITRWIAKRRGLNPDDRSGGMGFNMFNQRSQDSKPGTDFISTRSPFCVNCGAERAEGAKECVNCGKRY